MWAVNLSNNNYTFDQSKRVAGAPNELYRQVITLTFEIDAGADEIVIDEAASQIDIEFKALNFNTLGESTIAPFSGGSALLVTHSAPRRVYKVKLAGSQSSRLIQFFRVDVDKIVEEPTITLNHNSATSKEFFDGRFAIRLKDRPNPHQTGDIKEFWVKSYPSNPRLGIAPAGEPEQAQFFWSAGGEVGAGTPAAAGRVTALNQTALIDTLTGFVNRILADSPANPVMIQTDFVVESSAPCKVEVHKLKLAYRLAAESLPDGQDKAVLRFAAGRVDSQSMTVTLPGTAVIHNASLKTLESQAGSPAALPANGASAAILSGDSLAQKTGVHLTPRRRLAQAVIPAAALTLRGLALGLLALEKETEVVVTLQENWGERPSGKTLAEGRLLLNEVGRGQWRVVNLPAPLTLNAQPVWLVVQAAAGQAVWLAGAYDGETAVFTQQDGQSGWENSVILPQKRLLAELITPPVPTEMIDDLTPAAPNPPPRQLAAGGQLASISGREGDTVTYDLQAALNGYLQGWDGVGTAVIPLTFTAFGLKQITAYPPRIEYDLDQG